MMRISTEQDLIDFINQGYSEDAVLENDIILSKPLDVNVNANETYRYVFNGNHHRIANLTFDDQEKYPCLFPIVGFKGVIKDLTVEGVIDNKYAAGGITFANMGFIVGCVNKVNISGDNTGGICSHNMSTGVIVRCENRGNIKGEEFASGIAALNCGFIGSCANYGSLTTNELRYSDIEQNNFKYNQIAARNRQGNKQISIQGRVIDNTEYGLVTFPNDNTLLGQFLFKGSIEENKYNGRFMSQFEKLINRDRNIAYRNTLGQNYMHIIASRGASDADLDEEDYGVILKILGDLMPRLLALGVDFKDTDKWDNTFMDYLENTKAFHGVALAIKKEVYPSKYEDDDSFSDIGF